MTQATLILKVRGNPTDLNVNLYSIHAANGDTLETLEMAVADAKARAAREGLEAINWPRLNAIQTETAVRRAEEAAEARDHAVEYTSPRSGQRVTEKGLSAGEALKLVDTYLACDRGRGPSIDGHLYEAKVVSPAPKVRRDNVEYHAGAKARCDGEALEACPYLAGGDRAARWALGWNEAEVAPALSNRVKHIETNVEGTLLVEGRFFNTVRQDGTPHDTHWDVRNCRPVESPRVELRPFPDFGDDAVRLMIDGKNQGVFGRAKALAVAWEKTR